MVNYSQKDQNPIHSTPLDLIIHPQSTKTNNNIQWKLKTNDNHNHQKLRPINSVLFYFVSMESSTKLAYETQFIVIIIIKIDFNQMFYS